MSNLCTREDVVLKLGRDATAAEIEFIDDMLEVVTDDICDRCKRTLYVADHEETQAVYAQNSCIFLNNYPIKTVDSVTIVTYGEEYETTEYRISNSEIGKISFNFYLQAGQDVVVEYQAGYDVIPAKIRDIAVDYVLYKMAGRYQNIGLRSEEIGDYSYTTKKGTEFFEDLDTRLGRYIRA